MQRSEIREMFTAEKAVPDCASLHPGYKKRPLDQSGRCRFKNRAQA